MTENRILCFPFRSELKNRQQKYKITIKKRKKKKVAPQKHTSTSPKNLLEVQLVCLEMGIDVRILLFFRLKRKREKKGATFNESR